MLGTCRRLLQSTELATVSLLVVALVLLGIPLKASLTSSFLLLVAVVWQCAVGVSIWVRVIKPTRVELVDILGPGLATGAAFTALGWFALCRISWMTPRLFALSTVLVAIDGVRVLKTRYQNSDELQTPVLAVSIAILGLGYHRIGLLILGVGLLSLLGIMNFVKPSAGLISQKIRLLTVSMVGLAIMICAFVVQLIVSNNNTVGYLPSNDINFGEAIALGMAPDTKLALSPFTPEFRYHWLSHGWLGVLIRSFKLSPFIGPSVLVPVFVLTSTVCIVFSAIKRWRSANTLTAILTSLFIVAGASSADQLVFATDGSTSNQFGTLWLILAGYFLFSFLNENYKYSVVAVGSFLLGFLVMGTKGPLAIVLILSVGTYTLNLIYTKQLNKKTTLCLTGLLTGSALAYIILVQSHFQSEILTLITPSMGLINNLTFIFSIASLTITRIPLLFAPNKYQSDLANRTLAIGATLAGLGTFLFRTDDIQIAYFATGAIALATFYSGISSDLVVKTGCKFRKLVFVTGTVIFLTSLYLHVRRIYFSVLPKSIAGEIAGDYSSKLQNFQNFLLVFFIFIIFFALFKSHLRKRIQFGLIVAMLATTFGLYVGESLSTEIRQQAVGKYDLEGGTDDMSLSARAVVEASRWINIHSKSNDVVATNYSVDSSGIPYLVSVASQKSVLLESNGFEFSTLFVKDAVTKTKATIDFFEQPNAMNAKALTDIGVDWYLFATTDSQTEPSVLCQESQIWRCEFLNDQSVVIKFLDQN